MHLKIALIGKTMIDWGGGVDILRLFAQSLALKGESCGFEVYLLLPDDNALVPRILRVIRPYKNVLRQITSLEMPSKTKLAPIDMDTVVESFNRIEGLKIHFFENTRRGLISCLERIKADVALPFMSSLGAAFPVPWIGYIPDLQHKHFPEFFSPSECRKRDHVYATLLKEAQAVIVNSHAAKDDIARFFSGINCRIVNLPFAPVPDERWLAPAREDLREKYRLPDRYFIISNQFWVHKSHMTAFEALMLLDKRYGRSNVDIVCTGKTLDSRFPDYFDKLKDKMETMGVAGRVHFLGHIPKIDQIHILQESAAVIQPTLFEGGPGGGAVYDAVALGVPAIISNIPVNLEIHEDIICFFEAGSAEDLAAKMNAFLSGGDRVRPDRAELISWGRSRAGFLGDRLLEAVSSVVPAAL